MIPIGDLPVNHEQARAAAADVAFPDAEGASRNHGYGGWGRAIREKTRVRKPANGNRTAAWRNWTDEHSRAAIKGEI